MAGLNVLNYVSGARMQPRGGSMANANAATIRSGSRISNHSGTIKAPILAPLQYRPRIDRVGPAVSGEQLANAADILGQKALKIADDHSRLEAETQVNNTKQAIDDMLYNPEQGLMGLNGEAYVKQMGGTKEQMQSMVRDTVEGMEDHNARKYFVAGMNDYVAARNKEIAKGGIGAYDEWKKNTLSASEMQYRSGIIKKSKTDKQGVISDILQREAMVAANYAGQDQLIFEENQRFRSEVLNDIVDFAVVSQNPDMAEDYITMAEDNGFDQMSIAKNRKKVDDSRAARIKAEDDKLALEIKQMKQTETLAENDALRRVAEGDMDGYEMLRATHPKLYTQMAGTVQDLVDGVTYDSPLVAAEVWDNINDYIHDPNLLDSMKLSPATKGEMKTQIRSLSNKDRKQWFDQAKGHLDSHMNQKEGMFSMFASGAGPAQKNYQIGLLNKHLDVAEQKNQPYMTGYYTYMKELYSAPMQKHLDETFILTPEMIQPFPDKQYSVLRDPMFESNIRSIPPGASPDDITGSIEEMVVDKYMGILERYEEGTIEWYNACLALQQESAYLTQTYVSKPNNISTPNPKSKPNTGKVDPMRYMNDI